MSKREELLARVDRAYTDACFGFQSFAEAQKIAQHAYDEQLKEPAVVDVGDAYLAFIAGARSVRKHPDASDELIERSADAYVKLHWRLDGARMVRQQTNTAAPGETGVGT